ncbi:hypothetical protein GCM10027436_15720 [Actinophytocola sediminis]
MCTAANSTPPYPLRIPATGTTVTERRAVLRAAGEQLAARGLADERGPLGVAEAFAYLLQDCTLVLDLLLADGADVLGGVLLARRDLAVLVTQQLTGDHAVHLAELPLDDAVDDLLAIVPIHDAARTAPFSLPANTFRRIHAELRARRQLTATEWDELLAANGVTDRLARRLVTHLQPVRGNGQVGLATRGGNANEWRRVGDELRWLDTELGRYQLLAAEDDGWLSVNPMHPADLSNGLRRMAGALRT